LIDIHNHIIWDVDDGAKSLEESIEMAKIAEEDGIHKIIATPHYMEDSYCAKKEEIQFKINVLNESIKKEKINIEILEGHEVFLTVDIIDKIQENEVMTLNNSKYILIEFSLMNIPQNAEKIINNIMKQGYRPIIAHPERINSVVSNPDSIIPFIEMGCLTQITSGSILGLFGSKIKKTAEEMIVKNMAYIIASDGHNTKVRKPKISKAYKRITELTDDENVKEMKKRTLQIINNEDMEYIEPNIGKKKKSLLSKIFNKKT